MNYVPAQYPAILLRRAKRIRLLMIDVDGVLTDGKIYPSTSDENKSFHILDGLGIKLLQSSGVHVAIITGRDAPNTKLRAHQLGIKLYFSGVQDKKQIFENLCEKLQLQANECAFIGDDLVDLPVMIRCGLSVAVKTAHNFVKEHAHIVTQTKGGEGAVREVCDLIMYAQGTLQRALEHYLK